MSDELANDMHDDLPPLHDPCHVALNARDVMRPCGWAKSTAYQNLKDRNLVAPPVMTHPDRWRLSRFVRPPNASDAPYAAEPEITDDSAWRVTARQLYLRRAFSKAVDRSRVSSVQAGLNSRRRTVAQQPASSSTGNTDDSCQTGENRDSAQPSPTDQCAAQPEPRRAIPTELPTSTRLLAADQVARGLGQPRGNREIVPTARLALRRD